MQYTVKCHSDDPGSLNKHLGKSVGGGSFDWYSYLDGYLADILFRGLFLWYCMVIAIGDALQIHKGRLNTPTDEADCLVI